MPGRPRGPVRVVAALAAVSLFGSATMAVAHAGVAVRLPGAPDTSRVVLPAAIGFTIATVVLLVLLVGLLGQRRWAWPLGIAVFALTLVAAFTPPRGWVSWVGGAVCVVALALLVSPRVRSVIGPGSADRR